MSKRRRGVVKEEELEEEEEEEQYNSETDSESEKKTISKKNKKQKKTDKQEDDYEDGQQDEHNASDDDEEMMDDDEVDHLALQKELEADDEEDEDDDEDDPLEIGIPDHRTGKIKMIECQNFMCHKKFRIDFNEHINFITGPNGSGKSAVIAALQICLGMKAGSTQRGKQLKSLIRHGSDADAKVRVEVINEGTIAYKPEEFGKSIIIERTLKRSGGSAFAFINGETKKVVATNRKVLDEIITRFNIMIDNPVCILDQETSKSFLLGTSKNKHEVFMRATSLESMQQAYNSLKEQEQANSQALKNFKVHLKHLVEVYEEKKQRVKELGLVEELQAKKDHAEKQKTWIHVEAYLRQVEQSRAQAERAKSKMESAQQKHEKAQKAIESTKNTVLTLENESEEKRKIVEELKMEVRKAEQEEDEAKDACKQIQRKIDKYKKDADRAASELHRIADQLKRIEEEESKHDEAKSQKRRKGTEQLANLRAKHEAAEQQKTEVEKELDEFQSMDLESDIQEKKEELHRATKDLKYKKQQLEQLEATRKDATARFGTTLPQILRAIEKEKGSFSRTPVHVGLNVELNKMEYWRPVERIIGMMLHSFVVNSKSDMDRLKRICANVNARCPEILISPFLDGRHDTKSKSQLDNRFLTIEKAITVKNDQVFNALVDMRQIERVVLFRSGEEATKETFLSSGRMPQGMKASLDSDGNQYEMRNGAEYKQASKNSKHKASRFFSENFDDEIASKKQDVRVHSDLVVRMRDALKDLESQHAQESSTKKKLDSKLDKVYKEIRHIQQQIRQCESDLDSMNQEDSSGTSKFQFQRESLQNKRREAESIVQEKDRKMEELNLSLKDANARLGPLNNASTELKQNMKRANDIMETKARELNELMATIKNDALAEMKAKKKVEDNRKKFNEHSEVLNLAMNKANSARTAALEYCDGQEIPTENLTVDEINKIIQSLEKELTREQTKLANQTTRRNETVEEMLERAKRERDRAKMNVEKIEENWKTLKAVVANFRKSRKNREKGWESLKSTCQRRMNRCFQAYLSRRDHSGDLLFDDVKHTLNFTWKKRDEDAQDTQLSQFQEDENEETKAVCDTGQLSGGEKSFTTLAMLLAMGECVDSPFRVMDEFDVFMDSGNRKTSMELLVEIAESEKKQSQQYLFITPHDISMVPNKPNIRKHRMHPPEEDFGRATQQTLNLG